MESTAPIRSAARSRWIGLGLWWIVSAGCGGDSPIGISEPPPHDIAPTYAPCDQYPNYVDEVILNRWRSFPLGYFFDTASFPPEFLEDYRSAIPEGVRRWNTAFQNGLGAVVEVTDRGTADFSITYQQFMPTEFAARVTHMTGTPFLAGGEIQFNPTGMAGGEILVREGRISHEVFQGAISSIAAHEAGHLFGIIGHPRWTDVLMGPRAQFYDGPTIADLNTLGQAYCRQKEG